MVGSHQRRCQPQQELTVPIRYVQVASTFVDAFNSLLDTYQQIGEQIPLLESYKTLFSENSHMRQLLVMIYEDILNVHVIALRYFRQKRMCPIQHT